ncbi:MAG: hypothetical protein PUH00_00310 [Clostridiales bacterium]|nr:hypothetical protein [Clostridiales bacterium]
MAADGTRKPRRKKKKEPLSAGEKRRLRQLVICIILFGLVFAGRGIDLGPVSRLSSAVGELVRADTDFQAVFAQVGESFSRGEPAVETFKSLWTEVSHPSD